MKPPTQMIATLFLVLIAADRLPAQEKSPEIVGLEKAASDFVAAYNKRDAAAIAALFTENAELTDLRATDVITGRDAIRARYELIFADPEAPQVAVEVDSVRVVGKDLAVEDGTVHYTPPGDDPAPRSIHYTAVLQKSGDGAWRIASSRDLGDATDAAGQLADLANLLKGDWTATRDGMRLDMAFGWDDSGKFLSGEMLATAADAEPLSTSIRIGWDPAKRTITWWTFDDGGGFSKGEWTPTEDGWLIRTEGTTAEGEVTSANQALSFEGRDAFRWTSRDRIVDGSRVPDVGMRVVRQTPEPLVE